MLILLIPREVDRLFRWPPGRAKKLAKLGKIPSIVLPDGEIRFDEAEIESLQQPAKALELALRATRATKESNAVFLDTLAWAYFRNGDVAAAIRTEREALRLVPAGNALGQGLRSELEEGLAQFENPLKK